MIDRDALRRELPDVDAAARQQDRAPLRWQDWVNITWMVVGAGLLAETVALLDAPLAAFVTG